LLKTFLSEHWPQRRVNALARNVRINYIINKRSGEKYALLQKKTGSSEEKNPALATVALERRYVSVYREDRERFYAVTTTGCSSHRCHLFDSHFIIFINRLFS